MGLIFKIAWRNILRHKGKSLIIGAILFLGALIMTAGNGVITGMDQGLQKHIVDDFTGDAVIISDKQQSDNVFIEMMGKPVEPVYNYRQIGNVLQSQPYVKSFLPAGKNAAMVINEEGGAPSFAYLLGVDFGRYRKMFPGNIVSTSGAIPDGGEKGLLLPTGARKEQYSRAGMLFVCKDCPVDTVGLPDDAKKNLATITPHSSIVFMGMNMDNSSTDVRMDITGIGKYKALNTIWGHFILMDIESYRRCMGYFAAGDKAVEVTGERKNLLSMEDNNLDAMFTDQNMFAADKRSATTAAKAKTAAVAAAPAKALDVDDGAYNLVLVKFKPGQRLEQAVDNLNKALAGAKVNARAVTWKKAVGQIGSMVVLIKGALFVFVMFLFFVAIIIIVNTLSMAALERTNEIGMMRAVGARKGFISLMFFGETALLSFFFGGLGIIAGAVVVNIVSLFKITTTNDMIQLLYGGDVFNPFLTMPDIGLCLIQLALVTLIAVLYPLRIARNITPLDAITRD